jgi:hypothetical protein
MKSKLTLALAASMLTLALAASPQHAAAAGHVSVAHWIPQPPPPPPPVDVITSAVVTVIGTLLSGVQL